MKIQELRQLTVKKLYEQLKKARNTLAVSKFHMKTGQSQSSANVGNARKNIARILTLLKEKCNN